MTRPQPPQLEDPHGSFVPDQAGLGDWARGQFILPGTPLHNPDHAHLEFASIGWLWTDMAAENRGQRIAGEARMPRGGGSRWSQMMGDVQLRAWFGLSPDFVIIIDAWLAAEAPDEAFCALIEHELYHCAQATDEYGAPKFRKDGSPSFTMRGHDVEQFVGVVARYGAAASGTAALVHAAMTGPGIQDGAISLACGTCGPLRRAA